MQKISLSVFVFLLACGSSQENAETTSPGIADTATSSVSENTPEISGDTITLKEVNQVNDYAEYFLKSKIHDSGEEMNLENGEFHYYEILDIKNGYAKVTGAYEGAYEFGIWRMANGNDLVCKTSYACGPVCDYTYHFYEISGRAERDVTTSILPMDEIEKHRDKMIDKAKTEGKMDEEYEPQLRLMIPTKGTDLEVYLSLNANELEFPIVKLSWNKETFSVSKTYTEIP